MIIGSIASAIPGMISGPKIMNEGDVVSIDCGAIVDGWHGDAAFSVGIGSVDAQDQKLMDVCDN